MGREFFGGDHTGADIKRLNDTTGTVLFWITIPVLTSNVAMTVTVM
jgi:hypothetical protein